jgi:hypothetical protein
MKLAFSEELNIGYLSRLFDNTTTGTSFSGFRKSFVRSIEIIIVSYSMKT